LFYHLHYNSLKAKTTEECKPYDYFVENFPAGSLVEPFNSSIEEKVAGFIEKQMAKYEKAMKKKKQRSNSEIFI